jgi:transposase InsO family protein
VLLPNPQRSVVNTDIQERRYEGSAYTDDLAPKDWLADQTWMSADGLASVLAAFLLEYNNRPHRGLGLPGLSPNEFANRIWLL